MTFLVAVLDGFLRNNAELHIVVVAGEPNDSSLSVEQQLAGLRSVAPNASNVRMSVLVPTSSEACSGVNFWRWIFGTGCGQRWCHRGSVR